MCESDSPLAGEGWGEGRRRDSCVPAPSLSLPRKRGRGRRGTSLRNASAAPVDGTLRLREGGEMPR